MLMVLANSVPAKKLNETAEQWSHRMSSIESFVLHLRNLLEFFEPHFPQNDDVIATDFLASSTELLCPSKKLKDARIRANKEISHLTAGRQFGSPKTKEWSCDLLNDLSITLCDFTDKADHNRLAPETIHVIRQFIDCYPLPPLDSESCPLNEVEKDSPAIGWTGPSER